MSRQVEMVSLEELVSNNHIYRSFKDLWDLTQIKKELEAIEIESDHKGFGIFRLFLALVLQFMEDLSDRELEKYLQDNVSSKWFCDFGLVEKTPDHSVFGNARKRIGTDRLSKIFNILKNQLRNQGYMSEVFTFVDATHLISKANLWKERDKAIKEKYDKLNNETLPKVAFDKQAKIGCKGSDKYWYGYKKHISVDMQSGMVNKVAVTPANTTDSKGMKHVLPSQGAAYGDKGYCDINAQIATAIKGVHLAAIKKNNMKDKNKDLDRWYSGIRAPYERVFSKENKRVRYKSIAKNQFTAFMQAISHNLKRLVVLESEPPSATA